MFWEAVLPAVCWRPLIQRLLKRVRWERTRPEVGLWGRGMIGVRSAEDTADGPVVPRCRGEGGQ